MMYVRISRNWLFSRTAQRVYLLCAILDIALLATRMGIGAAIAAAGTSNLTPTSVLVLRALLLPEVVGSAVLFVGMSYCWLGFGGSYTRKGFWIVLVKLCFITAPVYYFAVYRRMASQESSLQLR
jgi:ABC-type spermidine/putrescine transport system permease subunit II